MRKNLECRLILPQNISIDEIVEAHIKYVTTPQTLVDYRSISCDSSCFEPKVDIIKEAKVAPRKAVLYHKYLFLLHIIISKCRESKNNKIHLEYKILTDILGDGYGDMLYNLKELGIINMTTTYTIGVESRIISLINWEFDIRVFKNLKVISYIKKYEDKVSQFSKEFEKEVENNPFLQKYNESLSYFELINIEKAIEYINSQIKQPSHSYHFYLTRIENFNKKNLKIISIDNNDRIYHYFTNLPKSLKQFFNIKYQLDISNSHPLLFSKYLIYYYSINKSILHNLYNIDIDSYHKVSQQLCKYLGIRSIDVPNDVLRYLYSTSKGLFWDNFVEIFGSMDRGEVKATLFKEVFYSNGMTTRGKEYAKEFTHQYPNVWKVIRKMKKEDKLPHLMMKFESHIFRQILAECYKHEFKVISIHDAIIVPNIEANIDCLDKIKSIMKEVYARYGLKPNVSIDIFQ